MKNSKIKIGTIARIVALVVVLVNQCLVMFGRGALPFTGELAYQIVTYALAVIVVVVNAWYNNDLTPLARTAGQLFDAMKDGKVTAEEVEHLVEEAEKTI